MTPFSEELEKELKHYINCCCMICTDPSIKIPQQSATDRAISAITELIKRIVPEDIEIQKIIASKHIYVDGHCDTDDFVTIPIIELSQALRTEMLRRVG